MSLVCESFDSTRSVTPWMLTVFSFGMLACGGTPTFPPLEVDAGLECSDDDPCAEGQVCLDRRCYRACSGPSSCGPLEVCAPSGVCMRGTPPDGGPLDAGASDAGPPDVGAPDPCASIECADPTPVCRAGVCLQCEDARMCGGAVPICDVGRGRCVSFAPEVCAACNTDLDCVDRGGTSHGRCVERGGPSEPRERVCLPSCTDSSACPTGYRCDGRHCLPSGGASCTQVRAALSGQPCATDVDCAPVGASAGSGLFEGSCVDMRCRIPCRTAADCPAGLTLCDATSFCAP